MIALLVVGTIIGVAWADTSDAAGAFAIATEAIGVLGVALLLIALVVVNRRERQR